MGLREPAWRVTTRELTAAVHEERGREERAATYLLSPFGARMNRVVVAGVLSAAEAIGREEPASFWKARLSDALGSVAVTAGSYQPRAMVQLRAAPPERPAIVIGKVHLYRARDGSASVSVRAEGVRAVAEGDERATVAEAVRQTLDRLDLLERLEHEPATTDEELRACGVPSVWVTAARASLRQYPETDRAEYRLALREAVARVAGGRAPPPPPVAGADLRITVAVPPPPPAPPTEAEREATATFLAAVDAAASGSDDGYADVRDVLRRLAERGVEGATAEALLGRLEEGGTLEEPIVGKLRRA